METFTASTPEDMPLDLNMATTTPVKPLRQPEAIEMLKEPGI